MNKRSAKKRHVTASSASKKSAAKKSASRKGASKKSVSKKSAQKRSASKKNARQKSVGRDKRMRNITRIEQYKKHQRGWWVRIHRDGRMIHKFFSDAAYRGEGGSLSEAKRYRDQLLIEYPKPERGNMFNRISVRNTSGKPGVHRTRSIKRGRTYDVWQASWMLPNGRHVNRRFAFSEGGRSEREARRLAIRARREGLATIEAMMRAKQERREKHRIATIKKRRAAKSRAL